MHFPPPFPSIPVITPLCSLGSIALPTWFLHLPTTAKNGHSGWASLARHLPTGRLQAQRNPSRSSALTCACASSRCPMPTPLSCSWCCLHGLALRNAPPQTEQCSICLLLCFDLLVSAHLTWLVAWLSCLPCRTWCNIIIINARIAVFSWSSALPARTCCVDEMLVLFCRVDNYVTQCCLMLIAMCASVSTLSPCTFLNSAPDDQWLKLCVTCQCVCCARVYAAEAEALCLACCHNLRKQRDNC
jgi:hypothetical protein